VCAAKSLMAAAVVLLGCTAKVDTASSLPKPVKGDRIVCYGDSITLVGRDNAYATILGRIFASARGALDVKVAREFIDGARTSKLARKFDELVLKKHPEVKWLVIQDAGSAEPMPDFEKGIREIIGKCLKRKIKIALVTTPEIEPGPFAVERHYTPGKHGNRHASHNELRRKLALEKEGVYLIDLEKKWRELMARTGETGTKLTYDGCHPDEAGLVAIATVLAKEFGIERREISFKSLGTFKKLTEFQFAKMLDTIYSTEKRGKK